ncbi:unnamed protein product [Rotaria magnacalcarata]|uniref:EGF-like domain-containing protein n=3 Tax=Rotaria magnacalcarata TaxID=392030 RepID=A0A819UMI4_9BILA|nr:unnamed protein product [Rotaria magnacalcarata]
MICHPNGNATCHNRGQCIPVDERILSYRKFTCICTQGFSGNNYELVDSKVIVSFEKDLTLPQSMFFLLYSQILSSCTGRIPFDLVFVELLYKIYYLAVVQRTNNRLMVTTKKIDLLNRCPHIWEVINETIVKLPMIRCIKYYHVSCQRRSPAPSFFYDEKHFCLCDDYPPQRLANCCDFDHEIRRDCFGQSSCENGTQCFQDNPICAQISMCACLTCFYGRRCQFSSNDFGLSLDGVLGYHILPHISIVHQSIVVKISTTSTIFLRMTGLIDGILSVITFRNETLWYVGSGIYLFATSITTLLTTIVFALKFWILVVAQMALIMKRSFLHLHFFMDYTLHEAILLYCQLFHSTLEIQPRECDNNCLLDYIDKWTLHSTPVIIDYRGGFPTKHLYSIQLAFPQAGIYSIDILYEELDLVICNINGDETKWRIIPVRHRIVIPCCVFMVYNTYGATPDVNLLKPEGLIDRVHTKIDMDYANGSFLNSVKNQQQLHPTNKWNDLYAQLKEFKLILPERPQISRIIFPRIGHCNWLNANMITKLVYYREKFNKNDPMANSFGIKSDYLQGVDCLNLSSRMAENKMETLNSSFVQEFIEQHMSSFWKDADFKHESVYKCPRNFTNECFHELLG